MLPRPRRDAPITREERAAARRLVAEGRRAAHAATMEAIRDEATDIRRVADAVRRLAQDLSCPAAARP